MTRSNLGIERSRDDLMETVNITTLNITSLEPLYQCLIQSKSTTPVSDAPSVFELVLLTFWRWFPGMAARQVRSHLHLAQKTVLGASAAKLLVPQTS
jgi:hypothetical protein